MEELSLNNKLLMLEVEGAEGPFKMKLPSYWIWRLPCVMMAVFRS